MAAPLLEEPGWLVACGGAGSLRLQPPRPGAPRSRRHLSHLEPRDKPAPLPAPLRHRHPPSEVKGPGRELASPQPARPRASKDGACPVTVSRLQSLEHRVRGQPKTSAGSGPAVAGPESEAPSPTGRAGLLAERRTPRSRGLRSFPGARRSGQAPLHGTEQVPPCSPRAPTGPAPGL